LSIEQFCNALGQDYDESIYSVQQCTLMPHCYASTCFLKRDKIVSPPLPCYLPQAEWAQAENGKRVFTFRGVPDEPGAK